MDSVEKGTMKVKKTFYIFVFAFLVAVVVMNSASAWWLNGTVYNTNGAVMNNATVSVEIYSGGYNLIGINKTHTNSTGTFNLSVFDNPSDSYKIVIDHYHDNSSDYVDYTGAILPTFPYPALAMNSSGIPAPSGGIDTTFFLKPAGTLNITAVNATGATGLFQYIVKDVATGSMIQGNFSGYSSKASITVPRDNNYSIEIFPRNSMPVSYEWDDWNALTDPLSGTLSSYNTTTHQLNKVFNTSVSFHRITGYLFNSTGGMLTNYDFHILPYDFEAGNMTSISNPMPANMSGFDGKSDIFDKATSFFNMTLPEPTETARMIFLAVANSSGTHLIGYRSVDNLSALLSGGSLNFTMYLAMGNSAQTISQNNGGNFSKTLNTTVYEQKFNVTNGTAAVMGAHIEASVDYSNYNATGFSFMADPSGSSVFYLPLINNTGLSSLDIYSHSYAPLTLTSLTTEPLVTTHNTIVLSPFSPKGINGNTTNVKMALLKSSTTCDKPLSLSSLATDNCFIGSNQQNVSGNPLSAIIGGGKVDFMMGLLNTGVIVKYVNVNMIASGPPSAMFDDSANSTSTSSSFSTAMRFGSLGPKIYDYAMVSIPYNVSLSGKTIKASIPYLYLDNASGVLDWTTPVWNTFTNGTSATKLAGNYSHFSDDISAWQTLLSPSTCVANVAQFGAAHPCYIDSTNKRIWLRIPHFSGIDPSITGTVTSSGGSGGSSGGGGGGGPTVIPGSTSHSWTRITPGAATIMKDFDPSIGLKQIQITVNNNANNVQITVTKYAGRPAAVSVNASGKVYQYLHFDTTNLLSYLSNATLTVRVNKTWVQNKSDIVVSHFNETSGVWKELPTVYDSEDSQYYYYNTTVGSFSYFSISEVSAPAQTQNSTGQNSTTINTGSSGTSVWVWVIIAIIVILIFFLVMRAARKKYYR